MARQTGDLLKLTKVVSELRDRITKIHKSIISIEKDEKNGKREPKSELEKAEIDELKGLKKTVESMLKQIEKLLT